MRYTIPRRLLPNLDIDRLIMLANGGVILFGPIKIKLIMAPLSATYGNHTIVDPLKKT